MITIEQTEVYGWEAAIRGMRNPMNSWDKSDSGDGCLHRNMWGKVADGIRLCKDCPATYESHCMCSGKKQFVIGENDLKLMKSLSKAGSVHAKYRRMITVTCDITAPLYWWKEFDTYKIGTVANSCSTMHKIHEKEFTEDDFSHEHLITEGLRLLDIFIDALNEARDSYLNFDELYENKELDEELSCKKDVWWQMIQLLPSSYNQKRTIQMNYEVLVGMYRDRRNHKLDEWRTFCDWIKSLPYSELIVGDVVGE